MTGRNLLTLLGCALLPAAADVPASAGGAIQVTVENIADDAGRIVVEVCPRESFLRDCALKAAAPAKAGTVTLTIRGVPPGSYALEGFHDRNGNGKLDTNLFGIPKEPVLFSRLAKLPYRRPRFEEASFEHGLGDQHLTVRLASYF